MDLCRPSLSFDHVIFDFDGTLVDSASGILETFSAVLREANVEACASLDSSLIGPPLSETLMRISGNSDAAVIGHLSERFKHYYDNIGVSSTMVYPGVEHMLDSLKESGIKLHICTNKRHSVTLKILDALGWAHKFTSIYALDMVEPRLPEKAALLSKQIADLKIDSGATIYIGDRLEDGEAADANGLSFFYASWGYGGLSSVQMNAHWHWMNGPSDLCHGFRSLQSTT